MKSTSAIIMALGIVLSAFSASAAATPISTNLDSDAINHSTMQSENYGGWELNTDSYEQ